MIGTKIDPSHYFKNIKKTNPLRIWMGIAPSNSFLIQKDESGNGIFFNGLGLKVWAGYNFFSIVYTNIEFFSFHYTSYKEKINQFQYSRKNLERSLENLGLMLSLSIPVDFKRN